MEVTFEHSMFVLISVVQALFVYVCRRCVMKDGEALEKCRQLPVIGIGVYVNTVCLIMELRSPVWLNT